MQSKQKQFFFCGTGQADTKAYMENLTQKNSQETTAKEKLWWGD